MTNKDTEKLILYRILLDKYRYEMTALILASDKDIVIEQPTFHICLERLAVAEEEFVKALQDLYPGQM